MDVLYKQLEELRHLAANVNLSQDYIDTNFGDTDWAALEKHGLDLNVLESWETQAITVSATNLSNA